MAHSNATSQLNVKIKISEPAKCSDNARKFHCTDVAMHQSIQGVLAHHAIKIRQAESSKTWLIHQKSQHKDAFSNLQQRDCVLAVAQPTKER